MVAWQYSDLPFIQFSFIMFMSLYDEIIINLDVLIEMIIKW